MIINDRVIFISIVKTAGTTIRNIWRENHSAWSKHTNVLNKTSNNKKGKRHFQIDTKTMDLKKYFIFTIVRNPYDRLVSLFLFSKNGGGGANGEFALDINMRLTIRLSSFKDFIIDIKNKWDTCKNDIRYKPMIDWIRDDDNNILTNKIVKFENLQEDMNEVFEKTGLTYIDFSKNHDYKSENRKHWMEYYDKEILDIVNELYYEDFIVFDYKTIKL